MRFLILALAASFAANLSANYIVKYKDGSSETSIANPTTSFASFSISGDIEYVEEDRRLFAHYGEYNDTYYSNQWYFNNYLSNSFYHAREYALADGGPNVTVAIIDTGITSHFELNQNVVGGYDMISDGANSRDGGGRDSDPSDEGDFGDNSGTCSAGSSSSTWHGTHIAGIVAARSDNNYGIVGAAKGINLLPVRVLGACGGLTSDIADAVRWAAGGSVRGAGQNPNPAKVINMSLGARGSCSRYMQESIDFAKSQGAVVVVATGNSNADATFYTPANCRGVLRVGAVNQSRSRSTYSNFGSIVDIAAPGDGILSTVNSGQTTPSTESFASMNGTSMAAGFISATAAMIYQANPGLYPDQVRQIITQTAVSYYCDKESCSKGAVDPYEAVSLAYNTTPNANFSYKDPVLVGGTAALNDRFSSGNKSGGACGTIEDVSSGQGGNGTLVGLFFIMAVVIFHRYKFTKQL
ncbi:serine metalloprotease MprA family protein [Halobacteriovorax sp. BALOs_7]|uniref:S8 family peptidase n=1 Tax=Halobacteriovorax sp. BALOs_7 TaxID=2109558 RepID=UPI000EB6AF0C|nr:S8 family peptidase [Halobacteriovorax sp. BALOs_7]AYF44600.1 serine metalloprotease MprA family protein [Halobacteriovorax sp. BALOs_7]